MLAVSIISLVIAVVAAVAAFVARSQAKTANNHAKEANELAEKANSVAEQARRDAREAPVEQARRHLYDQIYSTFTPMADAITEAWDPMRAYPIGPMPENYSDNLKRLKRLHDQAPQGPVREDVGRAAWELDSARITWERLRTAQTEHSRYQMEVNTQEDPDAPSRARENFLQAQVQLRDNVQAMASNKDQVETTARTLKPALKSLMYETPK